MEKFMLKNEKYPLVSVVMAVYNNMEEQVLRQAIESIMVLQITHCSRLMK